MYDPASLLIEQPTGILNTADETPRFAGGGRSNPGRWRRRGGVALFGLRALYQRRDLNRQFRRERGGVRFERASALRKPDQLTVVQSSSSALAISMSSRSMASAASHSAAWA